MSSQFNLSVEDIKNTLGNTDIIKNDVRIQKVIDLLRDNAKLVEAKSEDKRINSVNVTNQIEIFMYSLFLKLLF